MAAGEGRVAGKIALVTGAASGIGRASARVLAEQGATVMVADIEETAALSVVAEIAEEGGSAEVVALDVTDEDHWIAGLDGVLDRHGRLDILVNNAGIDRRGILERVSIEEIDAVLGVNLRGTILVARAAMPLLRAAQGTIVNVASELAMIGAPGLPVYVATKGGVVALTRALAVDHAADGIRVNCIEPAVVQTEFTAPLWDDPKRSIWFKEFTPMGRLAQPHELVGAVVYLASDASSYVTGQSITIEGGILALECRTQPILPLPRRARRVLRAPDDVNA